MEDVWSVKSVNSLDKVISYSKTKKLKANIIYCPPYTLIKSFVDKTKKSNIKIGAQDCHTQINYGCLLYTSPSPRDKRQSRMPSSA